MKKRERDIIIQYYKDSDNLQSAKMVLGCLLVDLSIKVKHKSVKETKQ